MKSFFVLWTQNRFADVLLWSLHKYKCLCLEVSFVLSSLVFFSETMVGVHLWSVGTLRSCLVISLLFCYYISNRSLLLTFDFEIKQNGRCNFDMNLLVGRLKCVEHNRREQGWMNLVSFLFKNILVHMQFIKYWHFNVAFSCLHVLIIPVLLVWFLPRYFSSVIHHLMLSERLLYYNNDPAPYHTVKGECEWETCCTTQPICAAYGLSWQFKWYYISFLLFHSNTPTEFIVARNADIKASLFSCYLGESYYWFERSTIMSKGPFDSLR